VGNISENIRAPSLTLTRIKKKRRKRRREMGNLQ
jgi:hypothetical protein